MADFDIMPSTFLMMFSKVQKALLGLLFLAAFPPRTAYPDDEIRIDLPAGGQLKVRNEFGNINAEVWKNSYVTVSANIGGGGLRRANRGPLNIRNRWTVLINSLWG